MEGKYIGFMCSRGPALEHLFAKVLLQYAENSYKVDCRPDWSYEKIAAAVERGAYKSAQETEVANYA